MWTWVARNVNAVRVPSPDCSSRMATSHRKWASRASAERRPSALIHLERIEASTIVSRHKAMAMAG